ncbi:MAG TPA: hypothetical protein VM760_08840 [Sphingomicrobium sp.]|jgi:hypothetical protein|nr:hypothetical protein [Sphingomicrobium sp.]
MDTAVTFAFADGEYRFWLPMPQVIELQRKCGMLDNDGRLHPKSILTIFDQISEGMGQDGSGNVLWLGGGSVLANEVNEVLRLGLIGGNNALIDGQEVTVGPNRAKELVEQYGFPARPLSEVMAHAWRVLHAAIVGIDVKKKEADAPAKSRKPSTRAS